MGSHKDKTYSPIKKRVLCIFKTRKEALQHEIYLHNKYNVSTNSKYANQANQTSTGFDTTGKTSWNKGIPCSKTPKDKIRKTFMKKGLNIGNPTPHSEQTKKLLSLANKGIKHPQFGKPKSEVTKKKISEAKKGHEVTKECRDKISETLKLYKEEYHWFNFHTGEEVKCSLHELMNNWGASNQHRKVITQERLHTNGWIII